MEQAAVLHIQCVFRGWAVRSRIAAKHSCALRIQTVMRRKLAQLRTHRLAQAKVRDPPTALCMCAHCVFATGGVRLVGIVGGMGSATRGVLVPFACVSAHINPCIARGGLWVSPIPECANVSAHPVTGKRGAAGPAQRLRSADAKGRPGLCEPSCQARLLLPQGVR